MSANKPLPPRVVPAMPVYKWTDWCPTCGLSSRPWDGCSDAYHSGRDKAMRLNERVFPVSLVAQVDPGAFAVPGVVDKKPSGGPPS
jgi:hypothetical protein